MEKKRLIGVKIFGVIFILLAAYLIQFPVDELAWHSPPRSHYRLYQAQISELEDFQIKNSILAPSANQILFVKKFAQFKQEAENFRLNYIVKKRISLHAQIFISIGFMTCLVFLITGLGLIMNFLWARRLALLSMLLSFLFYLALLFDFYSLCNFSNITTKEVVNLQALLLPSAIDQLKFLLQDSFPMVFLSTWVIFLPLALFAVCVIYYFTRPKVKEQFK